MPLPSVAARTLRGRVQLAGDGPQQLDALLEGADGGAQALETHGADEVGRVQQRLAVGHREAADGGHELRAVEQREAFLGLEREGREPHGPQGGPGRLAPALGRQQLALPHHGEHEVGRRGEVAGGAQRAPRRHVRHEVRIDHGRQVLGDLEADPGVTFGHRVEADDHGGAHDVAVQRGSYADGVAAHQVLLQLLDLLDGDARRGQLPEAGRDPVGHLLVRDDARDDLVRPHDAVARGGGELRGSAAARHGDDVLDGERFAADGDDGHCARLPSSRCRSSGTTSDGAAATGMPAASRAAFFSAAVPDEPSTMAPAWPMRLPGGALKPAM